MAFSESWIETDPDGSVVRVSAMDDYARAAKRQIRERLEGDPANPNSGVFESAGGGFASAAVVKQGVARAWAVTFANLGTLTLQDGRLAVTTDTNRMYHLKGTGLIELAYMPIDGSRHFTGAVTIDTGGITVVAGGVTITAGGLTVSAGTTALQALTATTATFSGLVTIDRGAAAAVLTLASTTAAANIQSSVSFLTGTGKYAWQIGAQINVSDTFEIVPSTAAGAATFAATAVFKVTQAGAVTISGGLTVTAGGVTITAGNLGVGTTSVSSVAGYFVGALSGSVIQHGIVSQATCGSGATTSGDGIYAQLATTAAAFTMASGYGIYIDNANKGAGSTITTQYGLYVVDQTQGGTNYAIYTNAGAISFGAGVTIRTGGLAVTGSSALNGAVSITMASPTIALVASGAAQLSYISAADNAGRIVGIKSSDNTANPKIGSFSAQDLELVRNGTTAITIGPSNAVTFVGALSGITTLSMSSTLTMTAAASKLVPGATSFSHRNSADSADNLIITDAGAVTIRASLKSPEMYTDSSAVTVPNTTATILFTVTSTNYGAYYLCVYFETGGFGGYATAIIVITPASVQITSVVLNGNITALAMSGNNVQVTQNSGSSPLMRYTYIRMSSL